MKHLTIQSESPDYGALGRFLTDTARPPETFTFHELQGFLFAVASSPETIAPSDWLPIIGDSASLNFANETEAEEILGLVMCLYNETNQAVLARRDTLPRGCEFDDDLLANFDSNCSIAQWSRGFRIGQDWLTDVWEGYLFDELMAPFAADLMVLTFFSSRQLAEDFFAEVDPDRDGLEDTTFGEFAATVRDRFPGALASYAELGRTIREIAMDYTVTRKGPVRSTKIGRNQPCPCGSGKKYKKCCGGPEN